MDALIAPAQDALTFERTYWVDGVSVVDDPFYTPPAYSDADPPGTLLRLDDRVDGSKYTLPPATALSRFLYLSRTLTGSLVPVSACILWPYSPRTQPDGLFPIVAWAHGTSSVSRDGAPSHHKHLWQHFVGPYQLALNGYVVVATDYAGLGVHHDIAGKPITHQYLAAPAAANDVVFAVLAARTAFPRRLSPDFVVIGHSQGGGATWAVAERQATAPIANCLGCVPVSPTTRILDEPDPMGSVMWTAMSEGMRTALPETDLTALLTPSGQLRNAAIHETTAGMAGCLALLQTDDELLRPHCRADPLAQRYQAMAAAGGKALGCPMLIVHGTADPIISPAGVRRAVAATRAADPAARIELVMLSGSGHTPALTGGQRVWMDWIADRFARRLLPSDQASGETLLEPPGDVDRFANEQNWFLQPATEPYHAP